jgi:hypothetical protein
MHGSFYNQMTQHNSKTADTKVFFSELTMWMVSGMVFVQNGNSLYLYFMTKNKDNN